MLALTAALIGPYFVDWTSYRGDFEREASRILGRDVKVRGTATARLLPFPSVTFSDVRVAGGGPDAPAMTVERFSMDAELAPFLRGEILIFDMRLDHPHITIGINEDGSVDWAARSPALFDPHQVTLEKVTITDGEITIHHSAGGRSYELTDIEGDVSAKSLAGPWRFEGSLTAEGEPAEVSIATGSVDENGRMHLRIRASPRDYPVAIDTDGDARIEDGAALYAGDFSIRESRPQPKGADETAPPAKRDKAPAYSMTGKFTFDHRRVSIDEFRFESGPKDDPYTASGTAFVDIGQEPKFGITANGDQVRFDEAVGSEAKGQGMTLDQRIAAFRRVVQALPKPGIPGKLDIKLPAIVAGDTTIRDVKLSAEPAPDGWSVKTLNATLPGRTTLEANGLLRTGEDFGFAGSLLLAVAQPSGFAAWISHDVDEAIRRLPAAGFLAAVDISEHRQLFRNLELILGDAHFRGQIDNMEPADANPSMMIRLTGGRLDVEGLAAFASLFVSDEGRTRLADHDFDFDIKAGPVVAAGLTAQSIDTALRLKGGNLEIDRLSVKGLAGATISATGSLKDFSTNPTGDLDASVIAVDLAPLVSLLAERYPDNAFVAGLDRRARDFGGLLDDTEIDLVASVAARPDGSTDVALSTHGKAGGSHFTASGSANGRLDDAEAAQFSLNGTLSNDQAAPVYALYGLPALPIDSAGHVETTVSVKGSLEKGVATSLRVVGDHLKASFDGKVRRAGDGLAADGQAIMVSENLQPWLLTAGIAVPGTALGLPASLAAKIAYSGGAVSIDALQGAIAGGAVSGTLKATAKDSLARLSGSLSVETLDLSLAAQSTLGVQALTATAGKWPTAPFNSKAEPPFAADIDLTAGTLEAGPRLAARDAKLHVEFDRGGLRISDLSARIDGGELGGLFELRNNGGTGLLSAQFKLTGADLGQLLAGADLAGKADLSASLTASGKSLDGMVASLAGSGTLSFDGLFVPGVNTGAFPALLAGADRIGRDIDAAKTAAFAPAIVTDGRFAAGQGELAFTVAGGVLRAPPLKLDDANATLTANARVDFNQGTADIDGSIDYQPGEEALVGSQPTVNFAGAGPLGAMTFRLDTSPLAQFLTQRALEREQARVEALQASLLEKQRLRREVAYYASLDEERARLEEEQRARAAEEARIRAEAERAAAEAAQRRAQEPPPEAPSAPPPSGEPPAGQPPASNEPTRSGAQSESDLQKLLQEEIRKDIEAAAKRRAEEAAAGKPQGAAGAEVDSSTSTNSVDRDVKDAPEPRSPATTYRGLPGVKDIFRQDNLSIDSLSPPPH